MKNFLSLPFAIKPEIILGNVDDLVDDKDSILSSDKLEDVLAEVLNNKNIKGKKNIVCADVAKDFLKQYRLLFLTLTGINISDDKGSLHLVKIKAKQNKTRAKSEMYDGVLSYASMKNQLSFILMPSLQFDSLLLSHNNKLVKVNLLPISIMVTAIQLILNKAHYKDNEPSLHSLYTSLIADLDYLLADCDKQMHESITEFLEW